jgi:hypothetical protein
VSDPFESVLAMVADGRLSAAEAEPILAALDAAGRRADADRQAGEAAGPGGATSAARSIRLEVTDGGRVAVKLRLPASIGDLSLEGVPGLSGPTIDRIRAALARGTRGPVFEALDEDGDGVRIVLD